MTVNIRYSGAKDGVHCWEKRRPLMEKVLAKISPDIIGFQEVKMDQLENLQADLPNYQFIARGRDDGQHQGEHAAIFYRNMQLIKEGTFWMSDTPDEPSKWGQLPRVCTWGHFRTQDGSEFAFYNTHLDNVSKKIRTRSVELILSRMHEQSAHLPAILVGDFNADPKEPAYKMATKSLRDIFMEPPFIRAKNAITFHEYTGKIAAKWFKPGLEWIDYIFITNKIKVIEANRIIEIQNNAETKYSSDHWQLFAELEL